MAKSKNRNFTPPNFFGKGGGVGGRVFSKLQRGNRQQNVV